MPNKYYDSSGNAYSQATIDRKRSEAYREKYGPYHQYCHGCGGQPQGSAHIVSQKACKNMRKVELIWNPENFFPACIACNLRAESNGASFYELDNWQHCLEVIKEHDPQRFTVMSYNLLSS